MKLETKSFRLEIKEIGEDGTFSGHAAAFGNLDANGDVVDAGAFKKTIAERPQVPIFWMHDPCETIGLGSLTEDSKGLATNGKLTLGVQRAREVYELMKDKAVLDMSIGYRPVKKSYVDGVRHLREIAVQEYSLLPNGFAANDLARVESVKRKVEMPKKYMGLWDDETEQVGCLLQMIAAGTDFAASEDDPADVAAMQSILGALAGLLASELAEVGADGVAAMAAKLVKAGRVLSAENEAALQRVIGALEMARNELSGVVAQVASKRREIPATVATSLSVQMRALAAKPA